MSSSPQSSPSPPSASAVGAAHVLMVHNYYQQKGGEDQVFAAEADLLESRGCRVLRFTVHNDLIATMNPAHVAAATVWNHDVYRRLRALVRRERPTHAHFHNTFPIVSPAAYYAVRAEGVPVVQTLHNYRLGCANAQLLRQLRPCEKCLGKAVPWPAIVHRCYRDSAKASAAVATMLSVHKALGTWRRCVDAYIALTEFARGRHILAGLPGDRIAVKPNFLFSDPGTGRGTGGYALFVGRLSPEKGLSTLLQAWDRLGGRLPLLIVGDGPMRALVSAAADRIPGVTYKGPQDGQSVLALMRDAALLVMPSIWYEGFPMTLVEAFAAGLPVAASDIGALGTLVDHGRTGLKFRAGDGDDLASKVAEALDRPAELATMRRNARREFELKYTAAINFGLLMDIYDKASG